MKKTSVRPKTDRGSRRRRIGMSDGFGGSIFQPDQQLWADLEAALAKPISEEVRKDLTDLVGAYYQFQGSERTAPFQDDVQMYLTTLRKDAIKLRKTFSQQDAAARFCLREVARECKIRNVRPGSERELDDADLEDGADDEPSLGALERHPIPLSQLDAIQNVLSSLINASSIVGPKIAKGPSFREGESWDSLILSIRNLFKRHGLPAGAAKETNRGTSSKFVLFVRALQKHFPEDLRRYDRSGDVALATQINRLGKKRDKNHPRNRS